MTKAKLINVIEVSTIIGRGGDDDPKRGILEYFSTDGNRLTYCDPWEQQEDFKRIEDVKKLNTEVSRQKLAVKALENKVKIIDDIRQDLINKGVALQKKYKDLDRKFKKLKGSKKK